MKAWRVQEGGSKPRPTSPTAPRSPVGAQSCWLSRPLIYTPLTLLPRPWAPVTVQTEHPRPQTPHFPLHFSFLFFILVILVFQCPLKLLAPIFWALILACIICPCANMRRLQCKCGNSGICQCETHLMSVTVVEFTTKGKRATVEENNSEREKRKQMFMSLKLAPIIELLSQRFT